MNRLKKFVITLLKILFSLYLLILISIYFLQEKLIFFPEKLNQNYTFDFNQNFEEINVKTEDSNILRGLLFKSDSTKGLIFYLHGNAGSLRSWGEVAQTYTRLHYDVFLLDYRGYGKSEGKIQSQKQLFSDVQIAYNTMKSIYKESEIIILGYSIGTGLAAHVASQNHPKLLILQAPYYSLTDMMQQNFAYAPTFILKYKLPTYQYLKNCKMPVILFHGDQDEVIYYGSSLKLQKEFKPSDRLITLWGQGHNGMTENLDYVSHISQVLK